MKINVIYFDAIGNYEKLLRKLEIRKSIIAEEEDWIVMMKKKKRKFKFI